MRNLSKHTRCGATAMILVLAGSALAEEPLVRLLPREEHLASGPVARFRFFERDDAGRLHAAPVADAVKLSKNYEDPRLSAARRIVAMNVLNNLPLQRRLELAAKYMPKVDADGSPYRAGAWDLIPPVSEQEYRVKLSQYVCHDTFFSFRPVHQRMLLNAIDTKLRGEPAVAYCFTPGTDPQLVAAFNDVMFPEGPAFQQTNRWSATATNPTTGGQGGPITLTYSFVPDGTPIPSGAGFPAGTSSLQAFLTGVYGSAPVWKQIYHDMFANWGSLCGINYVFEPNDDGVSTSTNPGVLGVRGDCRMSGMSLDGNNGVLAFNNFPNNGDMVLDAGDTFYATTTTDSRRLRNVLHHEHGHGIGELHVCPTSQTKLMEPFISVAYFGPQIDDILNAQRHYGDNDEPNDTPATAKILPSPGTTTQTRRTLSVDGTSDVDYYSLAVAGPSRVAVTIRPIGSQYIQGAQTSACDATGTTPFDPKNVNDLILTIFGTNGTTVLGTSNASGVGGNESLTVVVPSAGTYFARITGGATDNIQNYEIDYSVLPGGLSVSVASPPAVLAPGAPNSFSVSIVPSGETVVGTPQLLYRSSPGAYSSTGLSLVSGTTWTATLPAMACDATPEFYVEAAGSVSGVSRSPAGAPATVYSAYVGTVFTFFDDCETDRGWTFGVAGDTATSGVWVRGDPNGTIAQPEDDNDLTGTQCFFTGQAAVGAADGTADVDGGFTTLLSPIMDLSGETDATLSFARWYNNNLGASPALDTFRIDVSSNGGASWVNARTIGPATQNTGGWIADSINVTPLIPLTNQFRVRFVADDAAPGSLVEAAVDDVQVVARHCTNPAPSCPADFNQDGQVNPDDLGDYITCFFTEPPCTGADFNQDGNIDPDDLGDYITAFFGPAC